MGMMDAHAMRMPCVYHTDTTRVSCTRTCTCICARLREAREECGAALGHSLLRLPIDIDHAEARHDTLGPLDTVDERPNEVAAHLKCACMV